VSDATSSPPSQPPPGGPPNSEFRDAIQDLAKQAREDDKRADDEMRRRFSAKPISRFIRVGFALIVVQLAVYVYLTATREVPHPPKAEVTEKPAKDCSTVARRTSWKIVAYLNDVGHPPETLEVMLGKYLHKLPTDPVTGKPLVYSTDGKRFDLHCAPAGAR